MGTNAPVADQRRSAGAPVRAKAFSAAAVVPLMISCSLSRAMVGDRSETTPSGAEPGGNSSTYSLCGPFFLWNWGGSAPPCGPHRQYLVDRLDQLIELRTEGRVVANLDRDRHAGVGHDHCRQRVAGRWSGRGLGVDGDLGSQRSEDVFAQIEAELLAKGVVERIDRALGVGVGRSNERGELLVGLGQIDRQRGEGMLTGGNGGKRLQVERRLIKQGKSSRRGAGAMHRTTVIRASP